MFTRLFYVFRHVAFKFGANWSSRARIVRKWPSFTRIAFWSGAGSVSSCVMWRRHIFESSCEQAGLIQTMCAEFCRRQIVLSLSGWAE